MANITKPKKVIWFSNRHAPVPAQVNELRRMFPDCEIVHVSDTWHSVDELIRKFHELGGDEMATVLPLTIARGLTERGYFPLWTFMDTITDPHTPPDIVNTYRGKPIKYRFQGFERLTEVRMVFEDPLSGKPVECYKCKASERTKWVCRSCPRTAWGCNCKRMPGWSHRHLCRKCAKG